MLEITPRLLTHFAVLMPYPASILPGWATVALTAVCIAAVGWAIVQGL